MRAIPAPAARLAAVAVVDLALRDLLEGDREVVLRRRLDHRRRELLERALAQVVGVGVDLPRPLGGDDDARVRRVDVLEQAIDAGGDQDRLFSFEGGGAAHMLAAPYFLKVTFTVRVGPSPVSSRTVTRTSPLTFCFSLTSALPRALSGTLNESEAPGASVRARAPSLTTRLETSVRSVAV